MRHLNSIIPFQIVAITLLVVSNNLSLAQVVEPLEIHRVRFDIATSTEEEFPDGPTEIADRPIEIFQLADYTLAHVQYKSGGGEAFMKQSYVIVYQIVENDWKKQAVVPYNYEMRLIDKDNSIFFSENILCDMVFRCTTYLEFSQFINLEMKAISSHTGYDNVPYCDGLLSRNRIEELGTFKQDTIAKLYTIRNYVMEAGGLKSYDLETEVKILENWDSESGLSTKDFKTLTRVNLQK